MENHSVSQIVKMSLILSKWHIDDLENNRKTNISLPPIFKVNQIIMHLQIALNGNVLILSNQLQNIRVKERDGTKIKHRNYLLDFL